MKTRTLLLTSLLAATTLLAITPAASASTTCLPRCALPDLQCPTTNLCISPIKVLDCPLQVTNDPTSQPTHIQCQGGTPCGCNCPVVGASFVIEAAGQELDGHAASVVLPGCGFAFGADYTPGPIDVTTLQGACVTAGGYNLFTTTTFCAFASPTERCLYLGTNSPAFYFTPICALNCNFPPVAIGGLVGQAITYAETVATIWCNAANSIADTTTQAAANTVAYATGLVPCTGGCSITLDTAWIRAAYTALANTATAQANSQAGLVCGYLLGPSQCTGVGGPAVTGTCPVPIARDQGGVVGGAQALAGTSCDSAVGGVTAASATTKTAILAAEAKAGQAVTGAVATANAYAASVSGFAGQTTASATTAANTAVTAAKATCTATTTLATGGSCPV